MTPTFTIITATGGRNTLLRTLESLALQLRDGDEIMVERRDNVPWGNATRDEAIKRAAGSHLWWMDDDDVATPDALAIIREAVAQDPGTVHIFKMDRGREGILWDEPKVVLSHIGGTMCVVPNIPGKLGSWVHTKHNPPGKAGDFEFLVGTLELLEREPIFHEEIIAVIRPE